MNFPRNARAYVAATLCLVATSAMTHSVAADAPLTKAQKDHAALCALLDDPAKEAFLDGLRKYALRQCGRTDELEGYAQYAEAAPTTVGPASRAPTIDVPVNDPSAEIASTARAQNETTIARNENTGTLCSAFQDSYEFFVQGNGFTGFSRSTDGGTTFDDRGGFDPETDGDPSIVWRRADGYFYLTTLRAGYVGIYRSTDDCQTMEYLGPATTGPDTKSFLAVDNNLQSPFYGRLHLTWKSFANDCDICTSYSDNGTDWSARVDISGISPNAFSSWPAVGADGTVYVSWTSTQSPMISIELARSTDGGDTYARATAPAVDVVRPDNAESCGSTPALNGRIRYTVASQLAVTPNGDLHVIYSYDPDGLGVGDVVDVFYRRSTDQGETWAPEIRLSDDNTLTDQFYPTISASPDGRLVASWYDRRNDPTNNLLVDYYAAVSLDGGLSFRPNLRISDQSSSITFDPNLSACYHGDYDQQLQTTTTAFLQWADDRQVNGLSDSNVYLDRTVIDADFSVASANAVSSVCTPDTIEYDVVVGQGADFSDPVTLAVSDLPFGLNGNFAANPVAPGDTTTFTVTNTAALAAGDYTFGLTGTAGELMRTSDISLAVATQIPDEPLLTTPADGSMEVTITPSLAWNAVDQAVDYTVDIAVDPDFNNIVHTKITEDLSFALPTALIPATTYHWRVQARNQCGTIPVTANTFTTQTAAYCSAPGVVLPDDDPAGVTDTITIDSLASISDLNVFVDVSHQFVGDIIITVTHDDTGTSATLIDRPNWPTVPGPGSCPGNDISATLDDEAIQPVENRCFAGDNSIVGTFKPIEPLSVFDGESFAGSWTVSVRDVVSVSPFDGSFNEWCLLPATDRSPVDSDGDGVTDDVDNCTFVANPEQRDSNGDGFGNVCDADLNNDCIVNVVDLGLMRAEFFGNDADADLSGDGVVNVIDLGLLRRGFFELPGPAVEPNVCLPE